jgi:radical SAM protein with 4Fe4S-binding SPASM domain
MGYRFFFLLQKFSWQKLVNSFCLRISYLVKIIFKTTGICGLPEAISVEPSTICNLHCPQCTLGRGELKRQNNFFDFVLYRKLIDELGSKLWYVLLYFQGEPLMNKDFFDFVKYAFSKNVYTATSTNGHYLSYENCEKLVKSGLDEIYISLDGLNAEEYEKYRQGGDYDRVIKGIKNLVEAKKNLRSKKPIITLQFIVFSHNERSAAKFKQFAKQLGANIAELKTAQLIDLTQVDFLPKNKKYSRYHIVDGKAVIKKKLKNRCWRMWHSSVVTADGNVVPCCFDKNGQFNMGNLVNISFTDIWKSYNYSSFRNRIFTSRKSMAMCNNCTE